MNKRDLGKLNRILGMMGSDHAGERAAAALAADKLVKGMGLSWPEMLASAGEQPSEPSARRLRDYGIDYIEAAENRARLLRAENERLQAQIRTQKRRIETLTERLRQAQPQPEDVSGE